MKVDKLYLISQNEFANVIQNWNMITDFEYVEPSEFSAILDDKINGAVMFHVDHNVNKEIAEKIKLIEKNNYPVHKVDINGTLAATVSNLEMWLDRNRPKSLLILGCDDVAKSDNLNRFLLSLVKKISK